jgi:UDP-glucose 4-epimerase
MLGWQPRFDDLSTIVGHALAWERKRYDGESRFVDQTSAL